MAKEERIICISCPLGCEVKLTVDDKGEVVDIAGHKCKEGQKYALEESRNPVRVLTATVLTESSVQPLLPVRTSRPIPKTMLLRGMLQLAILRAKPPIARGDVILPDLLGTKANVVATSDLPRSKTRKR